MPEARGPWHSPAPPTPPGRHRVLIWIVLLLAAALVLIELSRLFPGAVSSEDEPYLVRGIVLLAFLSTGIVFARQVRLSELARNVVLWGAIVLVLAIGYAYRDELSGVGTRLRSEFLPGDPVASTDSHALTLTQDESGDFYVYGSANGMRIRFLVDTGASDIVLSPRDAQRLGIDTAALHFVSGFETANGVGAGASYTLETLAVGPIQLSEVPVSINRAEMQSSLLGMAFLKRLKSFEFSGRKLILRP